MTRKLVIIGAGMASGRMLEQLFATAPGACDVTLFNAEPQGNYNRLLLSPVLSGEKTYAEIVTHDEDWYEAQGDFADAPGREDIIFRDPGRGIYKPLVIAGDKLLGAVLHGDTADGNWFFARIKDGTDISGQRDTLIFGPAFQGGAPADPLAAVAALPLDAEICGCNGVCKGKIVTAIQGGAVTLDAVRASTKASSSCGTCTGLVEQVLALTLADSFRVCLTMTESPDIGFVA